MERLLIGLAGIVVLGVGAQWLSWRLKMPAILFLLVVGFLAGPVGGLIDPDALLGDLLFPIVSLSVAIILFEGGLSLDVAELGEIGRVVRNLVTVGVLITWLASSALAHALLGLSLPLSVLLGAVLVVTGPTVIGPLLRHIRPDARVGSAVKWEGIVNDPIGAILAVLVLEAILAGGFQRGLSVAAVGILKAGLTGAAVGLVGAGVIVVLLKRYWVPDFLQNPVALTLVLLAFAVSNALQAESGLLAVTVMGSALASQKFVTVRHIVEFKENLRVLLISALFIILGARLPLHDADYTSPGSLMFLAALVLLVRPLAVVASTWGSRLDWRERVFLGFMAPRGIVAAAVSSLFAIQLTASGNAQAARLVPLTFLVIVGTVTVYGLAAPLVARWLGVATPDPQGLLLVGAASWVRAVAKALGDAGVRVVLADNSWANVSAARREGLRTHYLNILAERAVEELDLDGVGRILALTPNDEVNALTALHFGEVFGRSNIYQLPTGDEQRGGRRERIPEHLRGRLLFGPEATHDRLAMRFRAGAVVKKNRLTDEFDFDAFKARYPAAIPLFLLRDSGNVGVFTVTNPPTPRPGHVLISLVDEGP